MNIGFFVIGGIIFAIYMYLTIWNIFYNSKKQREEHYPNYYTRYNEPDDMDMDGMGNYGRFPTTEPKPRKRPKLKKTKTKTTV